MFWEKFGVNLNECVLAGVTPEVNLRECISGCFTGQVNVRECISQCFTQQVNVRECITGCFTPEVNFRECVSAGVTPEVNLRECVSAVVTLEVNLRECVSAVVTLEVNLNECISADLCHTRGESQAMYVMYASAKCEYGCLLWFWNPRKTSPEVQNRGISKPTKRTYILQEKFWKKRKTENYWELITVFPKCKFETSSSKLLTQLELGEWLENLFWYWYGEIFVKKKSFAKWIWCKVYNALNLRICFYSNTSVKIIAGSFRVSLFIDLGCPKDLGRGWWGDLGTFMISRPI